MDDTEENKKKSEKQAKYLCNVQKKLRDMNIIVENEETKLFDLNETIRTLSMQTNTQMKMILTEE